eukprot:7112591-Prymnesium_polylepis.1
MLQRRSARLQSGPGARRRPTERRAFGARGAVFPCARTRHPRLFLRIPSPHHPVPLFRVRSTSRTPLSFDSNTRKTP